MFSCAYQRQVERWFDGETSNAESVKAHVEACPSCRTYLEFLKRTRRSLEAVVPSAGIAEAQMPLFMDGIRQRVHANSGNRLRERPGRTGFWALGSVASVASVASAAIIAAGSLGYLLTGGPSPAGAEQIVVESSGSEIEGASTRLIESEDGAPMLWVDVPADAWEYQPEGDMM